MEYNVKAPQRYLCKPLWEREREKEKERKEGGVCGEKCGGGGCRERGVGGGGWEARAGAVQSWNGHPELSLPCVAMETTFLPRLHPYRLLCLFFLLSLYLSFFSLYAFHSPFNLCLCFSLLLPFLHAPHIPVTTNTQQAYWLWCSALCVKVNG